MRATSWLHRSEAELGRTGSPQRGCSRDTLRTNLDSPPTDAFRTRGALDLAPPPQHVDSTSSYRVPARKLSFPDGDLPEATRAWGMLRLRGDPLLSLQDGRSFLRCTGDVHQGFTGWPVGLTAPTSTMVPAALPRPNQPSHDGQTDRQTHTQTLSGTNTMTRRQHQNRRRWLWRARTCRGCPSTMTGCQRGG